MKKILGKPNVIVRDLESAPGLWVFDDEPTGLLFLVWSDCWKKHPWKGTSFEVVDSTRKYHKADEAFRRLVSYFKEQTK